MTLSYLFQQTLPKLGPTIEGVDVTDEWLLEGTPNLRNASLPNAVLFGGPVVKAALEQAPIVGDRKHIVVDTKVSMLMPGWTPAIPGWHTDGVPRPNDAPSMSAQANQSACGYAPRYHTVVLGNPCLTMFLNSPILLTLRHGEDSDLYSEMTEIVNEGLEVYNNPEEIVEAISPPAGQWVSWDWWNIHSAVQATKRGWRLLIRISETDNVAPSDTKFIRAQNQVYVPDNFGW